MSSANKTAETPHQHLQSILSSSPVARLHGLFIIEEEGALVVACDPTQDELGANGRVHRCILDLMLRAAGHIAFPDSVETEKFIMRVTGEVPGVGHRLTARAVTKHEHGGTAHIVASVMIDKVEIANATYSRRREPQPA